VGHAPDTATSAWAARTLRRAEQEATILDYLAKHYGPKEDSRRQALPRCLMPDTPYRQDDAKDGEQVGAAG
jgi:hypothetical protein